MSAAKKFDRAAGILLPVSSLPSCYGIGTLGAAAYSFVDFLSAAGQRYWQVLPIGPTSYGDSPYQSFSAFAGNPYFIDLDILCDEGLLVKETLDQIQWCDSDSYVDYARIYSHRFDVLRQAHKAFLHSGNHSDDKQTFDHFCADNAYWLDDYSLFMALKEHFGGCEWESWDEDIRVRQSDALEKWRHLLAGDIAFWQFVQYKFFSQWEALHDYALSRGVSIIGDMPFYVAMDSADVWANTDQFRMDENKHPVCVAGVPPDYFSKTGQLWGNPLYDWDTMRSDSFRWWRRRVGFCSQIYDVVRIDHFIGIVRYYTIDAAASTAVEGQWLSGPGMELINAIDRSRGDTLIIAEDLGDVAPQVRSVQERSGYPGMKVLQFAFDGDSNNPFLPHSCERNFIMYTGTHDNNTTQGCIDSMSRKSLRFAREYLGVSRTGGLCAAMVRAVMASVAHTAIVPLYDWLGLGSQARINTPSTLGGNWQWRITGDVLTDELSARILATTKLYGRYIDEK